MELKKLILKNFRSHRNLTLDFAPGATAIIGSNGTGKSSVVEAILFLLTGDGYGKLKQEMTSVGETSGYVVGHFSIDGKPAILERHTDTSKVVLNYDGKTFKKSSEVTALWDSLFQIDKNIVKNVVIANQGEITTLFNGSQTEREKLFQKIFLVPNTTKFRDVIWQKYIKNAPPKYMVKDIIELRSAVQVQEEIVRITKAERNELFLDEAEYEKLVARKTYLNLVVSSLTASKSVMSLIPGYQSELARFTAAKAELEAKINSIQIDAIREEVRKLDLAKAVDDMRKELQKKRDALVKPDTVFDQAKLETLVKLEAAMQEIKDKRNMRVKITQELKDKLDGYEKSGVEVGICPTCGTELKDIAAVVEHTRKELAELLGELNDLSRDFSPLEFQHKALKAEQIAWESYTSELANIDARLKQYDGNEYFEDDHRLYKNVIAKFADYEKDLKNLDVSINTITADLNSAKIKLAGMTVYDKDESELAGEIEFVNAALKQASDLREKIRLSDIALVTAENELKKLRGELTENEEYEKSNKRREEYLQVLESLYDLFHTSKFPRALIHTYAGAVTEYMEEVLEAFNFPYRATVNESFDVEIRTRDGQLLPSVSGGQQVMVGFSLRLALHNMFSSAFPMMIIDEGSYGLATDAAKNYFEILSKLNRDNKFKQVIVIDHNPDLVDYVDHAITLQ